MHTPASRDMAERWRDAQPEEVVRLALEAELDVIAVTDHNTVEWCGPVIQAAEGTRLKVLPGVEVSTSEGHLLAIFDPDRPPHEINEFLVRIGLTADKAGDLNAIAELRLDELAEQVAENGGLAIAAHVDAPKGFWTLTEPTGVRRQQIHACDAIAAFELEHAELARQMLEGSIEGYPRKVTCVQGSDCWPEGGDSHQLDAIGRRHTLLRIDEPSLHAIRQALLDPGLRIRLPAQPPRQPQAAIEGLSVSGGFLDGARLRFNPGTNCLIGGTGAGKSLTLELLRFALDQRVDRTVLGQIANETTELLKFGLGDSATVRLFVTKQGASYMVERSWVDGEDLDPVVYRIEAGEPIPLDEPVHLPSFFPIKAFSQGEIIEYAREPLARLSLVDDLIDVSDEREAISDVKAKLRNNATAWIETRRQRIEADERLKAHPGIREQARRLASFLEDPRIQEHDHWYEERAVIEAIDEGFAACGEISKELRAPPAVEFEGVRESPNRDLLTGLIDTFNEARATLERRREDLREELGSLSQRFERLRSDWQARFEEAEREHQAFLAQMDQDGLGRRALHDRLTRLREQDWRLDALRRTVELDLLPKLNGLEQERDQLLTTLGQARRSIRDKRRAKADELTERLESKVIVTLRPEADGRAQRDLLNALRRGSRLRENDIESMVESLHPIPLVKSLLEGDFDTPAQLAGLDVSVLERFMETVVERDRLEDLLELQIVDREDVLRIRFEVDEQRRDLEALAHGQKCTVVLMVSMAEGDSPMIVDQPEDALHAPWIEDYIVTTLRSDRDRRQCIFATRSANVLVSADAEQVIAMASTARAGWVQETGGLDRFSTRKLVLYHVEGGENAFHRRQAKYSM